MASGSASPVAEVSVGRPRTRRVPVVPSDDEVSPGDRASGASGAGSRARSCRRRRWPASTCRAGWRRPSSRARSPGRPTRRSPTRAGTRRSGGRCRPRCRWWRTRRTRWRGGRARRAGGPARRADQDDRGQQHGHRPPRRRAAAGLRRVTDAGPTDHRGGGRSVRSGGAGASSGGHAVLPTPPGHGRSPCPSAGGDQRSSGRSMPSSRLVAQDGDLARSLIFARLYLSAVALVTTKPFLSCAGDESKATIC